MAKFYIHLEACVIHLHHVHTLQLQLKEKGWARVKTSTCDWKNDNFCQTYVETLRSVPFSLL
jgi:hypothetical protein